MWKWEKSNIIYGPRARHIIRGRNGYWIDAEAYQAAGKDYFVGRLGYNNCYPQTKYFSDIKFGFKTLRAAKRWVFAQRHRAYRSQQ